jgi:hypothetical protein
MKWVTRERPKIDRIACPWLIARFIDESPEFLFVPADRVAVVAEREGAVPFDVLGVKLSHVGEHCSFDTFLAEYQLTDPALAALAVIVRGADTARLDLAAQAPGLLAYLWVYRESLRTTIRCFRMAWSCMTRSTHGVATVRVKRTAGRRRRRNAGAGAT